jgi:tetratricopeptide (TPR) repeat protein
MARDDWFRNKQWNDGIESLFRAKLSRSRSSRAQYIYIQASYLSERYPEVALGLVEEYFGTGDDFNNAPAFCVQAAAYRAMDKIDDAVAAYRKALDWEEAHRGVISWAKIAFPKLIVETRLVEKYQDALEVLTTRFSESDHLFPITRYEWNGCCALISHENGEFPEALEFAERALRAAAEVESPFRYHRTVGLVNDTSDDFGRRIRQIVKPSSVRKLFPNLLKK